MIERIDFNIEDAVKEEMVCDINLEKVDISNLPLISGEGYE